MTDLFIGSILKLRKTKTLSLSEKHQIFDLWNNEYPRNLKYENFEQFKDYLKDLKDQNHILVLDENERIIGWYFDFIREEERWFAAILNSEFHGKKIGTSLMEMAKKERSKLNGWVITSNDYLKSNNNVYNSPVGFYVKNGFQIHEDIRLETGKINALKISWEKNIQK